MKATLATLACLLTVGFLSAAEVTGNNTAVVIRKNVVESDTRYQFLCVPVNGLDIANGTATEIKLGTLIPANTVKAGTTLTLVGGTKATYTSNGTEWEDGAADVTLAGGQIFWLRSPEPSTPAAMMSLSRTVDVAEGEGEEQPKTVIFCGQNRDRTPVSPVAGQVTAMANDSSQAITLTEVLTTTPGDLDTILVIQKDSSDYKQYNYFGGTWYGPNGDPSNNATIAPGEAFYYFKRR